MLAKPRGSHGKTIEHTIVSRQNVVYSFKCDLCEAGYVWSVITLEQHTQDGGHHVSGASADLMLHLPFFFLFFVFCFFLGRKKSKHTKGNTTEQKKFRELTNGRWQCKTSDNVTTRIVFLSLNWTQDFVNSNWG